MGTYTRMTRAWLDQRYRRTTEQGVYIAHQPVYGLGHSACEPDHLPRMARTFQILKVLNELEFESFLDVGASEGYLAHLVRDLFGADVLVGDLSAQASVRANELFGLEGVAFDSARLPFRDGAFDLVICSEVVEDVEFPLDVLLELNRVAGKALVLTTEEVTGDDALLASHGEERRDLPHAERNLFHIRDLELVFGEDSEYRSEYLGEPLPEPVPAEMAEAWIWGATDVKHWDPDGLGVILTSLRGAGAKCAPRVSEEALMHAVMNVACEPRPISIGEPVSPTAQRKGLRAKMVCPLCSQELRWPASGSEGSVQCEACKCEFAMIAGVPALYDETAPDSTSMDLETLLRVMRRDSEQIDALMKMKERLELPDATNELNWNFADEAVRKAWTPGEDLVPRNEHGVGAVWLVRGGDPWLIGPLLEIPEGEELELVVEMSIYNPDFPPEAGEEQIYWMGTGDLTFQESHSMMFDLRNDGQMHTYRIPITNHENWPKEGGLWLRFDPTNGPAKVELLSMKLSAPGSGEDGEAI